MKKLNLIFLCLILNSCHFVGKGIGIDVEIINNSQQDIHNIMFYTSEKKDTINIAKVSANKSVKCYLDMKENKSDGEYILEFYRTNGESEKINSGYYTNGGALDRKVIYNIFENNAKSEFKRY